MNNKNLTQNRRCRCSGISAYALCKFSAVGAASPKKPLANWPAAWATAPYKRNQFLVHELSKNLTQNRLCRSTDSCAYVLCKFSAAVATSVSWPIKPLANWPAAWATAPCKKSASLSWLLRKNLPRIVVVFLRACFQLVLNFRHQEGYQPPYQPRGPKHPKKQFLVYDI